MMTNGRFRSAFAGTFKEYPPRSIPPSFNPATILEETLQSIKEQKMRGGPPKREE